MRADSGASCAALVALATEMEKESSVVVRLHGSTKVRGKKLAPAFLLVAALLCPGLLASEGEQAVLDLNGATVDQLRSLPGVGPKRAEAIVELRQKRPFTRVTQLLEVRGIGKKTLERLRPRIRVGDGVNANVEPLAGPTAGGLGASKALVLSGKAGGAGRPVPPRSDGKKPRSPGNGSSGRAGAILRAGHPPGTGADLGSEVAPAHGSIP